MDYALWENFSRAVELVDVMEERGFEPNAITYGAIIKGLVRIGKTSLALGLLEKWEGRRSCRVDVVTYGTVLEGLCKEGRLMEALKLFHRMIDQGVQPNVVTYNTLVHARCFERQWEEVELLLKEMTQRGITPNVRTFNTILDAFCKDGMFFEAESILDTMIRIYIEPTVVTNAIGAINGTSKFSKVRRIQLAITSCHPCRRILLWSVASWARFLQIFLQRSVLA
ncbi:hypothetical protein CRG98_037395 [Punica granatum]|uniref:Uncharacterized protein n=1 Tax=Punica granatum TaxID=22663 RepID=A0A2I0IDY3_PUNGR|nr:hypothetical protein CRG98_037395 [Punica granatum]